VTKYGPIIMTLTFVPLFSAFPVETRFDLRMVHERAELCTGISSVDVEVCGIFLALGPIIVVSTFTFLRYVSAAMVRPIALRSLAQLRGLVFN
jgi:hypothetical protein